MSRGQMVGWAVATGAIVLVAAAFASGFISVRLDLPPPNAEGALR